MRKEDLLPKAANGNVVIDRSLEIGYQAKPRKNDNAKKSFTIFKADDDKRLVFGWASVSITVDGQELVDKQHDMIDPEDLEDAAYEYVLNFRDTGEEHLPGYRKKGKLVESCVFTAEKQKAMGIPEGVLPVAWWIGFKIEDEDTWRRVKDGTYRMFSIEGKAEREPVEKSAKTFDEVLKFNPYHDNLGRFSSANGAVHFTIRTKDPSKQHWADMAAEREKERTKDWPKAVKPKPKKETKPETSQRKFDKVTNSEVLSMAEEMGQNHFSRDDRSAMNGYFGTGNSFVMNRALRKGNPVQSMSESDQRTIKALDSNMRPSTRDIKVGRMVGGSFFESMGLKDFDQWDGSDANMSRMQSMVGKVYSNKGYTSTSFDMDSNVFTSRNVQLNINVPKGSNMLISPKRSTMTGAISEAEILLPRNTAMKVTGIRKTTNKWGSPKFDVDCEVITID